MQLISISLQYKYKKNIITEGINEKKFTKANSNVIKVGSFLLNIIKSNSPFKIGCLKGKQSTDIYFISFSNTA